MTDRAKRIAELPVLTSPALADLLIIEDDPSGNAVTKKITVSNLLNSNLINTAALSFGAANSSTASTVRLVDSVTNTSATVAASANSVKTAHDAAVAAYANAVDYIENAEMVSAQVLIISNTVNEPASNVATGTAGEIRISNDYIYVCIADNTWKRVAISDWS